MSFQEQYEMMLIQDQPRDNGGDNFFFAEYAIERRYGEVAANFQVDSFGNCCYNMQRILVGS